eukprot:scaffold193172_cov31-Tisochrysis_lutea.AAC.5
MSPSFAASPPARPQALLPPFVVMTCSSRYCPQREALHLLWFGARLHDAPRTGGGQLPSAQPQLE